MMLANQKLKYFSLSFLRFLFIFRQRGREEEKHQSVVAFHVPPTGDLAHIAGMCPRLGIEQVIL